LLIADLIRERGPLTVAAFMELALYDSTLGYYARAAQRSGRAGDFFTSVDAGPLFGELLEIQLAEMAAILAREGHAAPPLGGDVAVADAPVGPFDLVEAGAGNGRLAADVLRAARSRHPAFYDALRLHLVESSAAARSAQSSTLSEVADRVASSGWSLPRSFEGAIVANELLDALPVHQVVMRESGLREVYVAAAPDSRRELAGSRPSAELVLAEGPPSTPALAEYLERLGVCLEPDWRAEINLRAVDWVRDAARRLRRGFMILIDYGHDARQLYSASHSGGTLTTFSGHRSLGPEAPGAPAWLTSPGLQDITAHIDFTSVREAAEAEGMRTLGFLDQTYFVLGLLPAIGNLQSTGDRQSVGHRQSAVNNLKTLMMPGGLGSTHKVLVLGKGVGTPALRCCSFGGRIT
jgi:SAM-dependent MidA family methyltransferase